MIDSHPFKLQIPQERKEEIFKLILKNLEGHSGEGILAIAKRIFYETFHQIDTSKEYEVCLHHVESCNPKNLKEFWNIFKLALEQSFKVQVESKDKEVCSVVYTALIEGLLSYLDKEHDLFEWTRKFVNIISNQEEINWNKIVTLKVTERLKSNWVAILPLLQNVYDKSLLDITRIHSLGLTINDFIKSYFSKIPLLEKNGKIYVTNFNGDTALIIIKMLSKADLQILRLVSKSLYNLFEINHDLRLHFRLKFLKLSPILKQLVGKTIYSGHGFLLTSSFKVPYYSLRITSLKEDHQSELVDLGRFKKPIGGIIYKDENNGKLTIILAISVSFSASTAFYLFRLQADSQNHFQSFYHKSFSNSQKKFIKVTHNFKAHSFRNERPFWNKKVFFDVQKDNLIISIKFSEYTKDKDGNFHPTGNTEYHLAECTLDCIDNEEINLRALKLK